MMYSLKVLLSSLLLISTGTVVVADSSLNVEREHQDGALTTTTTTMTTATSMTMTKNNSNTTMTIMIEDFGNPRHSWKAMNDPVMGGESTGNVTLQDGLGIFMGQVVNVPFLDAPGFITMKTTTTSTTTTTTTSSTSSKRSRSGTTTTTTSSFPDVSSCSGLALSLRVLEEYHGYRISFGNVHVPGSRFAFGYKANLEAPIVEGQSKSDFVDVVIPFTNFSARWDDATGDQIVSCQEESKYCPTTTSLQDLKSISIWGEGVAGTVHLEIKTIRAVGCQVDPTTTDASDVDADEVTDVKTKEDDKNKITDPVVEDDYVANVENETEGEKINKDIAVLKESGDSATTSHGDNNNKQKPSFHSKNHHVLLQLFLSVSIAAAGIVILRSKHRRRHTYDPVGSIDMNLVV